jgi:regulation of enolase protein 1 (concanavalin A-like superfamily)
VRVRAAEPASSASVCPWGTSRSPASLARLAAVAVCLLVAAAHEPLAQSNEQPHHVAQVRAGTPAREPPDGWNASDIGRPGLDGLAMHSSAGLAVLGSGTGVDGVADEFHFLYLHATGDVELTARLVTASGESRMQAGAMIRASLEAGAPHASIIASGDEVGSVRRATASAETLTTSSFVPTPGAPLWMRIARQGQTVSLLVSADAKTWLPVGSEEIAMPEASLVGLAVASRRTGAVAWGVFDEVSVRTGLGTIEATTGERQVTPPGRARIPPTSSVADAQPLGTSGHSGESPRAALPRRPIVAGPAASDSPRVAVPRRGTSEVVTPLPESSPVSPSPGEGAPETPTRVPPPPRRWALFMPSYDHHWNVDRYQFEVVQEGTSLVVATQDLGKPPIEDGECRVDVSLLVNGLRSGSYVGVLKAVNARGESPATQSSPFTR